MTGICLFDIYTETDTTARSKYSLWKPITIYIELFVQYILLLPIGNKILQLYRLFQPQNQ